MFILKPGQFVHINKGRLHAFRNLTRSLLPTHDCHYTLRNELIQGTRLAKTPLHDSLCISVAWDWTYRGITTEKINEEVLYMISCADLNRESNLQSLAIPETSLLHTAIFYLACAKEAQNHDTIDNLLLKSSCSGYALTVTHDPIQILRGILPSLNKVVNRHKQAAQKIAHHLRPVGKKGSKQSLHRQPDSWVAPEHCTVDPYGNDYFCKFCQFDLSNVYLHCDGCENLLQKDFNICTRYVFDMFFIVVTFALHHNSKAQRTSFACCRCFFSRKYIVNFQMHPYCELQRSTINHTGCMTNKRIRVCSAGDVLCMHCKYCSCCSCQCHKKFSIRCRFMEVESEERLLNEIQQIVKRSEEQPICVDEEEDGDFSDDVDRSHDVHEPTNAVDGNAYRSDDDISDYFEDFCKSTHPDVVLPSLRRTNEDFSDDEKGDFSDDDNKANNADVNMSWHRDFSDDEEADFSDDEIDNNRESNARPLRQGGTDEDCLEAQRYDL